MIDKKFPLVINSSIIVTIVDGLVRFVLRSNGIYLGFLLTPCQTHLTALLRRIPKRSKVTAVNGVRIASIRDHRQSSIRFVKVSFARGIKPLISTCRVDT